MNFSARRRTFIRPIPFATSVEREVLARGAMVLSIFALIVLILVTPGLLGRPSPELASLPLLIIGMSRDNTTFIVDVGAAVQAYRYAVIRLAIVASQPWNSSRIWVNQSVLRNDTYGYQLWVPSNATFTIDAYFIDQQGNYFEYNVTAQVEREPGNRVAMVFTFPEPDNMTTEIRRYPPDDFRWLIPRRGTTR